MSSTLVLLLLVSVITLTGSFVCSLFEAALYSVTPSQIETMKASGTLGAAKLAELRADVESPIAAILTINTITHTIGSAWCGALVGEYYGSQWVAVFAGVFTLAVLLITEIIPKSVGVKYAQTIAPRIAWPLQAMVWAVYPLVWACRYLMRWLISGGDEVGPTEEEIIMSSRLAVEAGRLRPQELRWVERALHLDEVKAHDLMTPRTVVYTLPADMKLADIEHHSAHWAHSRLPLCEDNNPDKIIGLVYRRDIFNRYIQGDRDTTLRDLRQDIAFVPQTMPAHRLLNKFLTENRHLVCVVDEYGGFEGVVTLEDVLEEMIGTEIVDEHDRHVDMQQLAREQAANLDHIAEADRPDDAEQPTAALLKTDLDTPVDPPAPAITGDAPLEARKVT